MHFTSSIKSSSKKGENIQHVQQVINKFTRPWNGIAQTVNIYTVLDYYYYYYYYYYYFLSGFSFTSIHDTQECFHLLLRVDN